MTGRLDHPMNYCPVRRRSPASIGLQRVKIYQKQNEIVGPVLEKVKNIIKKVAEDGNYDFVFDTVAGNILYAEPVHDITEKVIYELERSTGTDQ